jgi:prefoldin subunit 5
MYSALESIGVEKRDLLVDRVSDARDAQESAKDQFTSALEQFRSVVDVEGGDLERTYDRLNSEYERSQNRAQAVSERIDAVEQVAEDLFSEWEEELDDYSSASLRTDSRRLLNDTQRRYTTLIGSMHRAESSMNPVLEVFQDQVLALKHNLNAQAIASLRTELGSIEKQTSSLVRDMERAIAEANKFIATLSTRGA